MPLTNRQQAFVEHYLRIWNATEAARQAGYSAKTAQEQGSRLLSNVIIQGQISERLAQLKMGADEVLTRLSSHARGTMDDFIKMLPVPSTSDTNAWVAVLDLAKAKSLGALHLVKKFRADVDGVTIELYDAQAALVQLGRHHKLFTDRVEIEDWRSEAVRAGVDPDGLVRQFVDAMKKQKSNADGNS